MATATALPAKAGSHTFADGGVRKLTEEIHRFSTDRRGHHDHEIQQPRLRGRVARSCFDALDLVAVAGQGRAEGLHGCPRVTAGLPVPRRRESVPLDQERDCGRLDAEGRPGEYQLHHRAYGREGKPCYRCGATIRRAIVAGRSSYFCPNCQPGPRGCAALALPRSLAKRAGK